VNRCKFFRIHGKLNKIKIMKQGAGEKGSIEAKNNHNGGGGKEKEIPGFKRGRAGKLKGRPWERLSLDGKKGGK